jgi:TolB-like protein
VRVSFGIFEFDPESGELRRGGRPVAFQRQPARMLAALVAKPGEIVSREALQVAVWGAGTHVDFERGLNFCAAQIRSALGDSARTPRYIETVPRRGYRFLAPVQTASTASADAPLPRNPRRTRLAASAAGVLIVAAAAAWMVRGDGATRIAVVPFDNETGSPQFDRTAGDLSDAVVARLAAPERRSRLLVIGNAASLRFTFEPRDLKAMGESLGARYILLGQLKRDDRRLRIVAHLIHVSDQTHLWAKTYDREVLDLTGQSEVAELIAAAVADSLPAD